MSKRRKPQHGNPARGHLVPQVLDSRGQPTVLLEGPQGPAVEQVADLVAAAFLGPCPAEHHLEHKNGDLADNNLTNLHYVPDE